MYLDTFPKDFPWAATSQGYFPKWHFPSVKFPKYVLDAALRQPYLAAALDPLAFSSRGARSPAHSSRKAAVPGLT